MLRHEVDACEAKVAGDGLIVGVLDGGFCFQPCHETAEMVNGHAIACTEMVVQILNEGVEHGDDIGTGAGGGIADFLTQLSEVHGLSARQNGEILALLGLALWGSFTQGIFYLFLCHKLSIFYTKLFLFF